MCIRDRALGHGARLVPAAVGGGGQVALELCDVLIELHDTSVTPPWCRVNTTVVSHLREQDGAVRMQEVAGEGIPLAGGAAAILLQVADPRVAAGVARHSDFAERPLDRLHGTLTYLYVLAYGTEEEQHRVARRVGQAHRPGPGCAGCGAAAPVSYTHLTLPTTPYV